MKFTVLYYSRTGNTAAMAEEVARGIHQVPGAEVKVSSLENLDEDWLNARNVG